MLRSAMVQAWRTGRRNSIALQYLELDGLYKIGKRAKIISPVPLFPCHPVNLITYSSCLQPGPGILSPVALLPPFPLLLCCPIQSVTDCRKYWYRLVVITIYKSSYKTDQLDNSEISQPSLAQWLSSSCDNHQLSGQQLCSSLLKQPPRRHCQRWKP